jgi:hypothetical protein
MNRKPQSADSWWKTHQSTCNGTFIKVSEPETIKKEKETKAEDGQVGKQSHSYTSFKGKGRTWSESLASASESTPKITEFFKKSVSSSSESKSSKLICVNCTKYETESLKELNDHLDICLKQVIDLT